MGINKQPRLLPRVWVAPYKLTECSIAKPALSQLIKQGNVKLVSTQSFQPCVLASLLEEYILHAIKRETEISSQSELFF